MEQAKENYRIVKTNSITVLPLFSDLFEADVHSYEPQWAIPLQERMLLWRIINLQSAGGIKYRTRQITNNINWKEMTQTTITKKKGTRFSWYGHTGGAGDRRRMVSYSKYQHGKHHEETDDVQVSADISPVIPAYRVCNWSKRWMITSGWRKAIPCWF